MTRARMRIVTKETKPSIQVESACSTVRLCRAQGEAFRHRHYAMLQKRSTKSASKEIRSNKQLIKNGSVSLYRCKANNFATLIRNGDLPPRFHFCIDTSSQLVSSWHLF